MFLCWASSHFSGDFWTLSFWAVVKGAGPKMEFQRKITSERNHYPEQELHTLTPLGYSHKKGDMNKILEEI